MAKLGLVAFLAMLAMVASSPITEEKRREEAVDLLRELLLADLEDEVRLEDSKRGMFLSSPTVGQPVYTAAKDMWSYDKYSFIVLGISTDNKWEVVGTGAPLPDGVTPSRETLEGTFDDMMNYLQPTQPVIVLFKRGTIRTEDFPYMRISWIPSGIRTFDKMRFASSIDFLMDDIETQAPFWYRTVDWETTNDISYDALFKRE